MDGEAVGVRDAENRGGEGASRCVEPEAEADVVVDVRGKAKPDALHLRVSARFSMASRMTR